MFKTTVLLGLTLFALFFGAGNLIFPIKLGWESGSLLYPAMAGFLLSGIGVPLLGLMAGTSSPGGIPKILEHKVSKWFSVLLMIVIYITIGPFSAIPRTATGSYDIGIAPNIAQNSNIYLFIFNAIYFFIVLMISLKPTKIVERIGGVLTPMLLIVIAILCIMAVLHLGGSVTGFHGAYQYTPPFTQGFMEGYLTMDGIASIAFSTIALAEIKAMGIIQKKAVLYYTCLATFLAGIFLAIVYISLGWIGNHYPLSAEQIAWVDINNAHKGAYILANVANDLLGAMGPMAVSIVMILACLTTAIGLIVTISNFFFNLINPYLPTLKYNFYVYFFTLISFIFSNQGLNQIIKTATPVLNILYPITILIIFLVLIDQLLPIPKIAFQITVYVTAFVSMNNILFPVEAERLLHGLYHAMGIGVNSLTFAWVLPALIALLIGYLIAYIKK